MTASRPEARPIEQSACDYDIVIVGAGISGIGAAYRLAEANPATRYAIVERRDRIGGTWDLFRYPGVRSDSSIFTLSWSWEPWPHEESLADGDEIRDYMEAAARKHGIYPNIQFNTRVVSADWDSATDTWTIHADADGKPTTYRSRFVFFGSGYYDFDEPHTPDFPGVDGFSGAVIHPQFWPEDLDYSGKRVVVIGSGATAVSLAPALARKAARVTMLQRSPGYLVSMRRRNRVITPVRRFLPPRVSYPVARAAALALEKAFWVAARGAPKLVRKAVRWQNTSRLPEGYPVDIDFKPSYNPWDERLCLVADGDLFQEVSRGALEVVTDHVDHFDATGIALRSGRHLDADIIVTATGLNLLALGGVRITIDGAELKPQERFSYKAYMLEDVRNLFWCIGYTNASWTLRADMTARATARLIGYMRARGHTHAYPHPSGAPMPEKPTWDLQAGYVLRNPHALPKSARKRPWVVRQDHFADALDQRFLDRVGEDMVFGRVTGPAGPNPGVDSAAPDHM